MELVTKKRLQLFSGSTHLELAQEIAECLDEELGNPNLAEFPAGELHCQFGENVRGADVFIIQSHASIGDRSINDSIMEQLIMIDSAKRASAKRITAVCPIYGYARQDRKASGREPITAKLVADMFAAAGAHRIVSVDLHSGQIQGFFDGPVDHLTAEGVLSEYLQAALPPDAMIVSPDGGRVKVSDRFAQRLGRDLAIVHKRRVKTAGGRSEVEARGVVGDVNGRTCVLIDDMIDTAGTICAAAEQLVAQGASEVWCAATHGVLSDPAVDRLKNSVMSKVVITNTVPLPPEKRFDKLEVLSVASIIAKALDAVFEDQSVSEIFGGRNLS